MHQFQSLDTRKIETLTAIAEVIASKTTPAIVHMNEDFIQHEGAQVTRLLGRRSVSDIHAYRRMRKAICLNDQFIHELEQEWHMVNERMQTYVNAHTCIYICCGSGVAAQVLRLSLRAGTCATVIYINFLEFLLAEASDYCLCWRRLQTIQSALQNLVLVAENEFHSDPGSICPCKDE